MPVTFGELTALAEDHLRFAGRHDLATATEPELVAVACALATCVARVADLIATPKHRPRDTDLNPAWRVATATVADQLTRARQLLDRTTVSLSPQQPALRTLAAAHLLSARVAIGASHDLLATHIDLTSAGPVYRTPLAATIDSTPARRQLTVVSSIFASQLAPLTDQLAAQLAPADRERGHLLLTAAGHLATTAAATRFVRSRDAGQRAFMRDVPVVELMRRNPPRVGETTDRLLEQALASAQRLQLIAFRDLSSGCPEHHTAGTLATVASTMVTSIEAESRLLDHLRRVNQHARDTDLVRHHGALEELVASTRSGAPTWNRIRQQWANIRGLPPALSDRGVRLEAADLTARVESLADAYSQQTIAAVDSAALESPPTLVSDPSRCLAGLARLLTQQQQIAASHARLTEALARTGRLMVPTRTLADDEDVPRPWAPLPQHRVSGLTRLYAEIRAPVISLDEFGRRPAWRDADHPSESTDRSFRRR